ncbi:MAG: serine/threonine-protein kinase [Polyangiaceae bacterium]
MASNAPIYPAGTVIAGKYRVERELGHGAYGVVLMATHLMLKQRVAIKLLTETEGVSPKERAEDAERFRREAWATATLKNEHVVRVIDVDSTELGELYIVMEYLPGQTIHEIIHTRAPLPIEEAVDYAIQILAALAEAHSVGIVHRDLKPSNVLVTPGPQGHPLVKVLDFGVSKIYEGAGGGEGLTQTGAQLGTATYMAPEQMSDSKRVDARIDVWAVGLLLYELLTKSGPFGSPLSPSTIPFILTKAPTPMGHYRAVPPELEATIMHSLEKSLDRRLPSAVDFARALAPFASPLVARDLDAMAGLRAPSGPARVSRPPPERTYGLASPRALRAHGGRPSSPPGYLPPSGYPPSPSGYPPSPSGYGPPSPAYGPPSPRALPVGRPRTPSVPPPGYGSPGPHRSVAPPGHGPVPEIVHVAGPPRRPDDAGFSGALLVLVVGGLAALLAMIAAVLAMR